MRGRAPLRVRLRRTKLGPMVLAFFRAFPFLCFGVTIVIPIVAVVCRAVGGDVEQAEFGVSVRQWTLMGRTVGLALAGVGVALMLSLPGAYAVGRIGGIARAPLVVAILVMPLLLPPMVGAFGWQRVWGSASAVVGEWSPHARCVWIWASWLWPIPAVIIGSGWSRLGRGAYEAALLVTTGFRAFRLAVIPSLWRHVLVSALILFVLLVGEYSVPHANGLIVLATELLVVSQVAQVSGLVEVLWLSAPLVVLIVVASVVGRMAWPHRVHGQDGGGRIETAQSGWPAFCLLAIVFVATTAVPIVALVWRPTIMADLSEALATYGVELVGSLVVCAAAGVLASLVGVAVMTCGANRDRSWRRRIAVAAAILPGIVPGALVGEAVLAAYKPIGVFYDIGPFGDWGWWLYNHWPIVVIGLAARYSWIGVLAAWLAIKSGSREVAAQAAVDGADFRTARLVVHLVHQWPTVLCGTLVAAAMAMSDVPVVSLVEVPSLPMIAKIVVEKFHRFETGMLVSLSLWMVASVLPGAVVAFVVLRRRD